MTSTNITPPDDLSGTADERIRQLELLAGTALSPELLRRQLDAVLLAWCVDETELDIDRESRVDY
ncbi:hypothetical protein ACPW96_19975 [Micromonospora sp. DT81.3]|uniref:hypothetical protein n=1 Tax=Micromonospora sp. DT81.3 TaxID=3416523 RepID=UPI003CF435D3